MNTEDLVSEDLVWKIAAQTDPHELTRQAVRSVLAALIAPLGENPPSAPAGIELSGDDTYQIWHALDERAAEFERDAEVAGSPLDRLAFRKTAARCERLADLFGDLAAATLTPRGTDPYNADDREQDARWAEICDLADGQEADL
ncbi:hypothetical protein GCM10009785_01250 [Brooklawnia cerclae]|uniref:Uncharacterized protein n=1 Tax=Brooklawnia cerclae TaxID=349934 RepID=A0ABX0SD20_9ACTN|nr:hypothetical protein [Brooklawnia cerclae]NIH56282.1 hypothetical protein [Brooklawnia cerclae]